MGAPSAHDDCTGAEGKKCSTKIIPLWSCQRQEKRVVCAVIVWFVRLFADWLEEGFEEGREGSATVAEAELGLGVEFGHGFFVIGKVEERVVTEAAGAAWGGQDFTFDGSVGDAEDFSVAGCGEDAVVAGCGLLDREFAEGLLEEEIVAGVGCCRGWAGELVVPGIAGGTDAGGSVEGVDFEAGVVGEDDLAAEVV